ncbi:S-adenosyl-L-methionine-dependent methyltransferase [Sistotremastrum niveocremeum HHB9708]|uniref:S-adenosyl-L-methionine-dependent methyltransferase n=1 Tax=Sistotremastrum niveocremeum HHB9708 TaxID=1314777 RepID=A0A164W394_9AGAM|nr:S-adenosyl-L-methionine-dependent methyltransferase [Sistotremastrum niveocremeum HHB9708]
MATTAITELASSTRELHGRKMNAKSEAYILPADLPEIDRLNLQHRLWARLMGSICSLSKDQLDGLLKKRDGPPPAILDLGRGTGVWSVEMAQAYPHAKVVGLDLVDSKPILLPPNCTFVTGDMTKGLAAYEKQFDLVHIRLVICHLKEHDTKRLVLNEAIKCLRPGGVIVVSDYNESMNNEKLEPVPPANDDDEVNSDTVALESVVDFARFFFPSSSFDFDSQAEFSEANLWAQIPQICCEILLKRTEISRLRDPAIGAQWAPTPTPPRKFVVGLVVSVVHAGQNG